MPADFTDEVAIVTGGGSGIGRAVVALLAGAGARVAVWDVNQAGAEESAALAGGDSDRLMVLAADISDEAGVEAGTKRVAERWGRLDILCNNAGVLDRIQPAAAASLDVWDRVMRVNATGTFLMTKAALPYMLERGKGAIVNTASAAGIRGGAAGIAYTASKHAVVGITRSVAAMYRPEGIRCNAVCPGSTNTNIASSAGGPFDEAGWASLGGVLASMGRMSEPPEIASAIVFLASREASYVNGAILPVDGGWTAG